jgi:gentisate 1,2-dioxygenase
MQQQRTRDREREQEQHVQDYEWNESRGKEAARRVKLMVDRPRVVKFDDVPWEQSQAAYHKVYTTYDTDTAERKDWTALTGTLRLMMQTIPTGHKNGNHRHIAEVPFYIYEGKGHEMHDGKRHDWEAGDLMIVPPYSMHQHFCDEGPAILVYCQAGHGPFVATGSTLSAEQLETHESWALPDDAIPFYGPNGEMVGYKRNGLDFFLKADSQQKQAMQARTFDSPPKPSHPVTDGYEYYVRQFQEECYWRQNVPQVVKQSMRKWENTRNGKTLWFLHPAFDTMDVGMKLFEAYLMELPPGGHSGKHRHLGDEIHFIIEGEGYEEIEGTRWAWGPQDAVSIPNLNAHQSFNASTEKRALFLVYKSRTFEYSSFAGIEHLEDAGS